MSERLNTFCLRLVKPINISSGKIVSLKSRTNIFFSIETGLSYSDRIIKTHVDKDRIYLLSNQKLSIVDRYTRSVVGFVERPKTNVSFYSITTSHYGVYIGTSFGIYLLSKERSELNQTPYLKLIHHPSSIGGGQIRSMCFRQINGQNFLAVTHENGLTIIYNDTNYDRKLITADSSPKEVYLSQLGEIYYQHSVDGLYAIKDMPPEQEIDFVTPNPGYLFTTSSTPSIASQNFIGLAVTEGTSSNGFSNTIFLSTSTGFSIISESDLRYELSSVKEVSMSNIQSFRVSPDASADSGKIFLVTTDGRFKTYDLSTDSVVENIYSGNDDFITSSSFSAIEEI